MMAPVLPESAPFSPEQRHWLNGFLAGLSNFGFGNSANGTAAVMNGHGPASTPAFNSASANGSSSVTSALPVLILYGSQSGTAEGLAHALAEKLKASQGAASIAPRVLGMEHFKDVAWASEKHVLLMSSTWGDGDMPDNAAAFWEWLKGSDAPAMSHLSYAVLGLGDRNYARFCQAGKNLDGRFAELGAKRLLPLCECDTDYETKTEKWMTETSAVLDAEASSHAGSKDGAGSTSVGHSNATVTGLAATNGHANGISPSAAPAATKAAPASTATTVYGRKNPFSAALLENHPLNAKGSAKDTRHLSFSLLGSGLEYKVGDALGIFPRNCYDLVDRVILTLNCLGNEKVTLEGGEEMPLRSALLARLDLRRASPRLLQNLRDYGHNGGERRRLNDLFADEAKTQSYLSDKDLLDVLEDFPHTRLDAQHLVETLSKLAPRLYSISSSPKENPGEVHLTVGVVRYRQAGRMRRGVASTFLAERLPLGMTVPVFIQPAAHFGLPAEKGKPIIMVGPGTGIAPFRAFLQERRCIGDTGKNWLFFGDQRRQYDFLYAEECVAWKESGHLTNLDLAFSRDQEEKVYVQTRMLEKSKELYAWLEEGAYFYVCGDAKRMAKDVEEALLKVIETEGGQGVEGARAYLEKMKTQKRYLRDVY